MNRKHIFNSNATPQRFYSHGENFKQVVVAVINTYACNLTSEIRHTYVVLGEHLGYSDTRIAPRPLARLGDMISFRFCHISAPISHSLLSQQGRWNWRGKGHSSLVDYLAQVKK